MVKGIARKKKKKRKEQNMENWIHFVKLKHAHSEPTKHSEVCTEHFTKENYTNQLADLTDKSCKGLEQRLKRMEVHNGYVSFST